MRNLLQLTLGVVTAVGGFVDIGELVFAVQAGVKYQYMLLWALVVGTVGIIIFSEMSGRIAAVTKKPVMELVKATLPRRISLTVLVGSTLLNGLTCAAELGGVAIALQLLIGIADMPAILLTFALLAGIIWFLPFKILEKLFGLLGLFLCVFIVVAWTTRPDAGQLAAGLVPRLPSLDIHEALIYFYFALGLISSSMMPYEVYFYSSGGIEEKWTPKDLTNNRITAGIGMSLGGILAMGLIVAASQLFGPAGILPQLHGTSALMAVIPFGKVGLFCALMGIIFAVGGAAVETCLAGAYNIAQYFGWKWGRYTKPEKTPLFTVTWLVLLGVAFVIIMFGIDPIKLAEYAVVFSVVVLPFTYFSVLKTASDSKQMGEHKNSRIITILGWVYMVITVIIAVAAIPLMILTNMGKG
jgi:manganese transport protein